MSVRMRKWKDKVTGKMQQAWIIDVKFRHADGTVQRVQQTSQVQTRRGAEHQERQLRESLLKGTYGKETKQVASVEEFSTKFLTHAKTNNKYSTLKTKGDILRKHLLPAFGKTRLDKVSPYQIEAYKGRKLDEGLSSKTINNQLTVLRKLLSLAVDWRELDHVPKVAWMRVPKPDFDFLSFEEADRLIAAAEPDWRPMILVALHTGLRIGELTALQWDCVELVAGRVFVKRSAYRGRIGSPKNGRSREVPLSDTVRRALREHRHLRGPWVFCTPDGNMLNAYNSCQNAIARQCRRAGLRSIGWHTLRHSFASHLVMKGTPLKVVQELLGHATIEMTMRYSHLSPEISANAVKVLDSRGQQEGNMREVSKVSS